MSDPSTPWQSYEDVARRVLQQLRTHLGLTDVSGYEHLAGNSGTSWRVEGIAITARDGEFLILECRRHTQHRLTQEDVGGLAFRIHDTGAGGAILVEVDNNAVERAIRAVALGRKNYLFAGSDAGGERAAALYRLIGTAKLNGLESSWERNQQ